MPPPSFTFIGNADWPWWIHPPTLMEIELRSIQNRGEEKSLSCVFWTPAHGLPLINCLSSFSRKKKIFFFILEPGVSAFFGREAIILQIRMLIYCTSATVYNFPICILSIFIKATQQHGNLSKVHHVELLLPAHRNLAHMYTISVIRSHSWYTESYNCQAFKN